MKRFGLYLEPVFEHVLVALSKHLGGHDRIVLGDHDYASWGNGPPVNGFLHMRVRTLHADVWVGTMDLLGGDLGTALGLPLTTSGSFFRGSKQKSGER